MYQYSVDIPSSEYKKNLINEDCVSIVFELILIDVDIQDSPRNRFFFVIRNFQEIKINLFLLSH